jgi:hypothetical protein
MGAALSCAKIVSEGTWHTLRALKPGPPDLLFVPVAAVDVPVSQPLHRPQRSVGTATTSAVDVPIDEDSAVPGSADLQRRPWRPAAHIADRETLHRGEETAAAVHPADNHQLVLRRSRTGRAPAWARPEGRQRAPLIGGWVVSLPAALRVAATPTDSKELAVAADEKLPPPAARR